MGKTLIENNLVKKVEANLNIENKKKKIINKSKIKQGNINSTSQIIENQTIQIYLTSPNQLKSILGVANNDISNDIKKFLMTKDKKVLKKSFKDVSPLYLATYASKDFSKKQVEIIVSKDINSSLKKQAIEKINLLTQQDLDLLKILNKFFNLIEILNLTLHINQSNRNHQIKIEKIKNLSIIPKIKEIKEIIYEYKNKYKNIDFDDFENMLNNNIIKNNGILHFSFEELIFKIFIYYSNDKSKNEDYCKEDFKKRMTKNRFKWTNWFNKDKYNGTDILFIHEELSKVIKEIPMFSNLKENKKLNFYWHITIIGITILRVI